MHPRIITAATANAAGPSGGSRYNEHIAGQWGVDLQALPGSWPDPSESDMRRLCAELVGRGTSDVAATHPPILLDGLIGCAAPQALRSAAASGVRVVLIVHLPLPAETGLSRERAAQMADLEQQSLALAAAVACTSHWAAADLQRRYPQTMANIAKPVVAAPGATPAPLATGSEPPLFLTPAAFTPRKNHPFLLSALSDSLMRDVDFEARWVGAEPITGARRTLQQKAIAAGLDDRIRVQAAMNGSELDALYARSNLVLLPSIAETYAMVLSEGFARGIPAIVGADTGAAATLQGRSEADPPGVAVSLDDPHGWAKALHQWCTDTQTRLRWREAAVQRRTTLPTWARAAHTLWHLVNRGGE
ncbi:MAG: glycosyltransferase family 4 protein [Ornithinimicrobium sp.]